MTDNASQSSSTPRQNQSLPGFRELFPEYVVSNTEEAAQPSHATTRREGDSRPTTQGVSSPSSDPRSMNRSGYLNTSEHGQSSTLPNSPRLSTETHTLSQSSSQQRTSVSVPPSEEKKHVCTICTKGFARASSLNTHYNSHTGEKPYICPFLGCESRFSVKSNMLRHYRTHPGTE